MSPSRGDAMTSGPASFACPSSSCETSLTCPIISESAFLPTGPQCVVARLLPETEKPIMNLAQNKTEIAVCVTD